MSEHEAKLAGRRALVTGAASGIGLALATRLVAAGCEVIMSDVTTLDAAAEVAERHSAGTAIPAGRARTFQADLTDRDALAALAAFASPADILVNNAGLQHVSPLESFPPERWDTLLSVLVTAPFLLTRALLPGMYDAGWGRVINISSVHGLVASPFKAAYVTAKHALLGLTKVIALEAAARAPQVTAHAICPTYVRTPLVEAQIADQARAHGLAETEVVQRVLLAPNAIRQLIEPADVAEAAMYLCGPAAWTMSGAALTMDAGWLAH